MALSSNSREAAARVSQFREFLRGNDRAAELAVNILKDALAASHEQLVTYEGDELLRAQGAVRRLRSIVNSMSAADATQGK